MTEYDIKLSERLPSAIYICKEMGLSVQEWIKCSDRLPARMKRVIIFIPSNKEYGQDMYVAFLCDWDDKICSEWHIDAPTSDPGFIATFPREYITYWMSLPEPPKDKP